MSRERTGRPGYCSCQPSPGCTMGPACATPMRSCRDQRSRRSSPRVQTMKQWNEFTLGHVQALMDQACSSRKRARTASLQLLLQCQDVRPAIAMPWRCPAILPAPMPRSTRRLPIAASAFEPMDALTRLRGIGAAPITGSPAPRRTRRPRPSPSRTGAWRCWRAASPMRRSRSSSSPTRSGPHFADPLEGWGEALMAKNQSHLALAKFAEAEEVRPQLGPAAPEMGRGPGLCRQARRSQGAIRPRRHPRSHPIRKIRTGEDNAHG